MKEKKEVSIWYASATFYLTAGFAMPFIAGIIYDLFISRFIGGETLSNIVSIVFGLIGIWIGIVYAAKYIKKAYIIRDAKKLVNISTIYLIILPFILLIGIYLFSGTFGIGPIAVIITIAIRAAIFYPLSRFYVKEDVKTE